MSFKDWEKKVLDAPGASERVAEIEDELRLAAGLTALRERAGLSQRELAARLKVSQPRVAAIERADNLTVDVLAQYVAAVGGQLEISVLHGELRIPLSGEKSGSDRPAKGPSSTVGSAKRGSRSRLTTQRDASSGRFVSSTGTGAKRVGGGDAARRRPSRAT